MGMLFYGSLEYFIENGEEDTGFYSIPQVVPAPVLVPVTLPPVQGMWWAVQTLTSLGYGDFSPTTLLGKLVGSACAVSGVLVMALPIPIVVDNFGNYYADQKKLEAQELKKEAQEKAARFERRQERTCTAGLVSTVTRQRGVVSTPSLWSMDVSRPTTLNSHHTRVDRNTTGRSQPR